jgi:hypothetical protein
MSDKKPPAFGRQRSASNAKETKEKELYDPYDPVSRLDFHSKLLQALANAKKAKVSSRIILMPCADV